MEGEMGHERFSVNLAKLKKGTDHFEVDVDADMAIEFKHGKNIEIGDVLRDKKIFSDAKKGMLASEKLMKQYFKTSDPLEVAKIIIMEGEIQLTTEYRAKKREEKKKRIMDIIHRNGVDPKTHLPHPLVRIENAFKEAKIKLDEYAKAEDQVQDVLKQLRVILPIKFEVKEIAIKIPPEYAAKAYSVVKGVAKILRDDWQSDGSWSVVVEIPGGLEEEFFDKLNSFTHGNMTSKIINTK